jgi:Ca2+-binding EF-hand superfamily protein
MATSSAITAALLSSAYRPQQQDLFSQIDANGDGQISPDELSAFGQNLPGASGATGLKNRNLFQKIDTNGDGVISKEEWAAYRAARERTQNALLKLQEQAGGVNGQRHHGPSGARQGNPGAIFSALDTNKDGVISAEEWAAAYGASSGVTIYSDVKPVGAAADTGIAGSVNSALNGATNAVKSTVDTITQTLNALI